MRPVRADSRARSPESGGDALQAALAYHRAGDTARAEDLYREAVSRDAGNANAWFGWSCIAMEARDYERAAILLEKAVHAQPNGAVFLCNLGEAYRRLGRCDAALSVLRRAVSINSRFAEAQFNLGLVLRQQGRLAEAVLCFEAALAIKPALPRSASMLVNTLRKCGEYERAIAAYRRFAPKLAQSVDLICAGANALADIHRLDEATSHFVRALKLDPTSASLHADYAVALADLGRLDEAMQHCRRAIELEPSSALYHSRFVYSLQFHPQWDAQRIRAEALEFHRRHAAHIPHLQVQRASGGESRRLRVGYVSADFRRHVSAHFILPLFRHHDREAFMIYCYSDVAQPDAVTQQARALVDQWCDISRLDDEAAAQRIHEDQIDVLVDLGMHTGQNRLLVFARKPAPVQVCWLAYPGTTGLKAMDYRLTDVFLDPPGQYDDDYVEALIRLPETFWCYDPLAATPVNALPALAAGHFTFGCLNRFRKVTQPTLSLWARVLRAVPGSRLRTVAPLGKARASVRRAFERGGVDPDRVEFLGYRPREQYLEAFHQIDGCLDTLPCNGGTTSLDSFWMGVPVLTLAGPTAAGRAGASIARNLGLPELVATSAEEYVECAVSFASDLVKLSKLRQTLRSRMERSPLMDAPRFARNIEAAYRKMWSRQYDDPLSTSATTAVHD